MYRFTTLAVTLLVLASLGDSPLCAAGADADGIVEVRLGATIQRTWDQVKADNYAYGPKQQYDTATGETHIYLPYGDDWKLYHEVRGMRPPHRRVSFLGEPGRPTTRATRCGFRPRLRLRTWQDTPRK